MEVKGKVVVITGGASGIGAAIARQMASEGAEGVVVADVQEALLSSVAEAIGPRALAVPCDASRESAIQDLGHAARERFGRVDIYISNAGILGQAGGIELPDTLWDAMWKIHTMAHVWAARAILPHMLDRGEGYFLVTASAAGLLNIVESAPYGVTKHAAVAFAEWLRITYGQRGIRVSCLCPQSVGTPMTAQGAGSAGINGILSAADVALAVLETMRQERFLCLPHPEVETYMRGKTQDYDRWLGGMQKLHARYMADAGAVSEPGNGGGSN